MQRKGYFFHQFHIQNNVSGRLIAPNIISGNQFQVAELIINLAYGKISIASKEAKERYLKMENNCRKKFVEKIGGYSKTHDLAKELGIEKWYNIPLDVLIDMITDYDKNLLEELLDE